MDSSQFLFNRQWKVTIGLPGDTGYAYDSLKTVFDLEKVSRFTSNKGKIALYNLSGISRQTFQKKGLKIRLDAGYKGLIETVYLGDVVRTTSERKQADIITTFECGDAEKNLEFTHFQKSYPAATPVVQVIKDIAVSLGVNIGTIIGIQNQTYNRGVAFSGAAKNILDEIVKGQGLEASVQNGYLQIIPITKHNGEEAIVLSKTSGLIGVPSLKESGIEFDALLNPRLLPGTPVQLISETINGFFKIRKAHFEGDSHGEKWQVKCEGVKINAQQSLPFNAGTSFVTVGTVA